MSHRKISSGARQALLARFQPDGYVLATVMDQTIGFIVDGEYDTTVHREATLFVSPAAAEAGRLRYLVGWKENLTASIDDPLTSDDTRTFHTSLRARVDDSGPWIEPVQVWAHFCDRPDTW